MHASGSMPLSLSLFGGKGMAGLTRGRTSTTVPHARERTEALLREFLCVFLFYSFRYIRFVFFSDVLGSLCTWFFLLICGFVFHIWFYAFVRFVVFCGKVLLY